MMQRRKHPLNHAFVTIDLEYLDELRESAEELVALKRKIAAAFRVEDIVDETGGNFKERLTVDVDRLVEDMKAYAFYDKGCYYEHVDATSIVRIQK